ncbi:MAG: hypothetical protein HWN67_00280 [Candidatus Helarchaeota archaeon]|nr:hypothetical protein [Candidatus Helarchaeota archaeon]
MGRKDIAMGWAVLLNMVKEDVKSGKIKEWGAFAGELRGYTVLEGTPIEISDFTTQYAPFVTFTTHILLSVDEVEKVIKNMAK